MSKVLKIGLPVAIILVIIAVFIFSTRQNKDPANTTDNSLNAPSQTQQQPVEIPEQNKAPITLDKIDLQIDEKVNELKNDPLLPTCTFPPHWGHCAKPPQNRIRYFRGSQTGGLFFCAFGRNYFFFLNSRQRMSRKNCNSLVFPQF